MNQRQQVRPLYGKKRGPPLGRDPEDAGRRDAVRGDFLMRGFGRVFMAIENRKCICRLARAGVGLFLGALSVCGGAAGQSSYQPAVTTGSVVTIPSSTTWGQVYKIVFYDGSVLALDAANDALYQLSPRSEEHTSELQSLRHLV